MAVADTLAASREAQGEPGTKAGDQAAEETDDGGVAAYSAGEQLGYYIIEEPLGSGGMGTVYAAYDPRLDRKVAVKVLHDRFYSSEAQGRLISEAKLMAKLSHPNVVTIYEVGRARGVFFIAMEHVDGQTLAEWLRGKKRTWQEICEVHIQAGRGMAAAHDAEIVHRDFKPANVLVGKDERVRVSDFGIARAAHPASLAVSIDSGAAGSGSPHLKGASDTTNRLIAAVQFDRSASSGTIEGTLPYLAPELFDGERPTQRSDQYSFCISLWEALFSVHPFGLESLSALLENMRAGAFTIPAESAVPGGLVSILKRGLQADPEARYPSMRELLEELEKLLRPRARWLGAGAAGVALLGLAGALLLLPDDQKQDRCNAGEQVVAERWAADPESLHATLLATGAKGAAEVANVVSKRLESYASGLATARDSACRDTRILETHSEELMARRMACLDRLLDDFAALTNLLSRPDAGELSGYLAAVFQLQEVESCRQPVDPTADVPPELAEDVQALQLDLADAVALERAGLYRRARAQTSKVLKATRAIAYQPLEAEALFELGRLEYRIGRPAEARTQLLAALSVVEGVEHRELKARILLELVLISATALGQISEAEAYREIASATVNAMEYVPRDLQAELYSRTAAVSYMRDEHEKTQNLVKKSLRLRREFFGSDHPEVAGTYLELSQTYINMGKLEEALEAAGRAIEIFERTTTRRHPYLAFAETAVGSALFAQGDLVAAEKRYLRALDLAREALDEDHKEVAVVLHNLGLIAAEKGEFDVAIERLEQALAIDKRALGDRHVGVAQREQALSQMHSRAGDLQAARRHCERAVQLRTEAWGTDDPRVRVTRSECP